MLCKEYLTKEEIQSIQKNAFDALEELLQYLNGYTDPKIRKIIDKMICIETLTMQAPDTVQNTGF
jgi:hypothetical protein